MGLLTNERPWTFLQPKINHQDDASLQLDLFCRQYLQIQFDLNYPDEVHLRNDVFQQALHARLFGDSSLEHMPPQRYQLRALKELVKRIELSIQDWEEEGISDDLMNHLSSLFSTSIPSEATSAQQTSYVQYTLSCLPHVSQNPPTTTLLEARNIVAASGTTGLRTWEAALHLGNYLCTNPALVQGKSILELGAGTGYLSILCAKHLHASHVIATDGSDDVVSSLSTNYYLNSLRGESKIQGKELKWGQALIGGEEPEWEGGRKIDLVLGADLTYDGTEIPALVSTFGDLSDLFRDVKIIIAATVRNVKTLDGFLETCRRSRYVVEEIDFPIVESKKQHGPFYSDLVPIRLCLITRIADLSK